MNRSSLVIAILMCVLISLGANIALTLKTADTVGHQRDRLSGQVFIVCQEHKTIARIAREEAEESASSNRNLLPKANIPGLSHKELVESTEKKQAAQLRHAAEYALIQKETC